MRAKVVLSASVLALLVLAPVIYLHFKSSPAPDQGAPAPEAAVAAPTPAPPVAHHPLMPVPANGGQGIPVPSAADLAAADHADYVDTRQRELAQLGMSDDPSDLKIILSELNNKDPGIRKSALSAAVQFGSPDAIPALQNEIAWAEDPQEKVDLLNAIKFLQLPSFVVAAPPPQRPSEQPPPSNN